METSDKRRETRTKNQRIKLVQERGKIEKFELGEVHWHKFKSSNFKGYKYIEKRSVVYVICNGCKKGRWVTWHSIQDRIYNKIFTGGCKQCFYKRTFRENSFNWKGGRVSAGNGYILIRPEPGDKIGETMQGNGKWKYILEHRLVKAHQLNRPIYPHEHVHHINRIKDDNRPENLELVTSHDHVQITALTKHIKQLEDILTNNGLKIP